MRLAFTQESDFRQQRDFGQKFSATFEFIGQHWRGLGRALLYLVLPAALLHGIIGGLAQAQLRENLRNVDFSSGGGVMERLAQLTSVQQGPYSWLNILVSMTFIMLMILTVYGYLLRCLRPTPDQSPITVGEVWDVVKASFARSALHYIGLVLVLVLAFMLLAFPGIYLSVPISLFYVVRMVEKTSFTQTISRCLFLTKGKWWSTFGLIMVMAFMLLIVIGVVSGAIAGLAVLLGGGPSRSGDMGVFTIVLSSLNGLFSLLIYPPLLIALAFQYFNLVERKEGVGLRSMVNQLGQAPAPVQNAALRPDDEGEY